MERGLIITLPYYDDTTEYLSQWSLDIIEKANEKSIKIKKIEGEEVSREFLEKAIKKLDYKMLLFNAHGSEDTIYGHNNEVIIEKGNNDNILIGRIVYARSCNSAESLGKTFMESNKGCFIGYNKPFMFYVDTNWTSSPKKDKVAEIFLSSSNQVPISILKGSSCQEAHENSKKIMLKYIKKLLKNKSADSFRLAEALLNNYLGQTLLGNKETTL